MHIQPLVDHRLRDSWNESPFVTETYNQFCKYNLSLGIEACNWYDERYIYVNNYKGEICDMFNDIYRNREIGGETCNAFQSILQLRLSKILPKYDLLFQIYDANKDAITDRSTVDSEVYKDHLEHEASSESSGTENTELKETNEVLVNVSNKENGTIDSTTATTGSNTETFKDTPTSSSATLNNPTNQTIDSSSQDSSTNQKTTNEITGTTESNSDKDGTSNTVTSNNYEGQGTSEKTYEKLNTHFVDIPSVELERIYKATRSLVSDFVNEFEPCFIGVLTCNW